MNEASKPQLIRDDKDLHVWQKGHGTGQAYLPVVQSVPCGGKIWLVWQTCRAAVSVPSNVAEGQVRNTTGEFIQFLSQAEGSAAELDTQLRLAIELEFALGPMLKTSSIS